MFSFYFTLAREVWSTFFPSKPSTTNNPLKYITSPTLALHTGPFSYFCHSGITSRSDLEKAGENFKVKAISLQKKNVPPRHEFNLITAINVDNKQEIGFILERTLHLEAHEAEDNSLVECFLVHEDSMKVLRAVLQASLGAPPDVTDLATLSLTAFFNHLSQLSTSRQFSKSLNPKARAQEKWLAGVRIETPEYGTAQGARTFEPKNLTLLHLSLLADLVHAEYPLYSLLKNNSFWYSNIFFNCAVVIDSAIVSNSNSDHAVLTDTNQEAMFYLPYHMYLPRVAGRYMSFKVCEVEKIVVSRIVKLFFEQLEEFEREVRFLLSRHYR
jgi:hypothetical protein